MDLLTRYDPDAEWSIESDGTDYEEMTGIMAVSTIGDYLKYTDVVDLFKRVRTGIEQRINDCPADDPRSCLTCHGLRAALAVVDSASVAVPEDV